MSMTSSLSSATMVGGLGDYFKNFTVERLTRAGAWGIDRELQEGVFWNFPNKPLTLVSFRVFDPREPQSVVKRHYFLLLKEDLHKPEVVKEIEGLLSEAEKNTIKEAKKKSDKGDD